MYKITTSKNIYVNKYQPIELDIWEPSLFSWKDVISDYNWILKNRFDNKLAMFKVQLGIVPDIDLCQKSIKMYKDVRQNPENIIKYTNQDVNTNEKHIIERIQREKILIKALKDIMDGHLWRIFNYNRALIYVLGSQPGSTYLDIGKGGFNEIYAWADSIIESDNTHFLINNITNSAKIGDLLVKTKDGKIVLSEIKSSSLLSGKKQKQRQQKQESRRKNFECLANDNEGIIDNEQCKIIKIPNGYTNKMEEFLKLLNNADSKGLSNININNYLHITCIDYGVKVPKENIKKSFQEHLSISSKKDEIILVIDSSIRNKYSPKFIPFSIYPIPNNYIADLLLGKKMIFYSLNVSKILKKFSENGWSIISTYIDQVRQTNSELAFCTIQKNKINIDVPWTIPNQIIFELRDINSIITEFNYILNISNDKDIRILSKYEADSNIWN
ncbi:MAG: hypothetical protein GWP19_09930 [Planctomycetia bacterium]|nr:hypothetical protein [Planctomycetia bacterium]